MRYVGFLAAMMAVVTIVPVGTAGLTPAAAQDAFQLHTANSPIVIVIHQTEQPALPQMYGNRGGGTFISGPAGANSPIFGANLGNTDSNIGPFGDQFGQAGGFGDVAGGQYGYPTGGNGGSDPPSFQNPAPAAAGLGLVGLAIFAAFRRRLS